MIDKDKCLLYDFARSGDLWRQRIAVIATMLSYAIGKIDPETRGQFLKGNFR